MKSNDITHEDWRKARDRVLPYLSGRVREAVAAAEPDGRWADTEWDRNAFRRMFCPRKFAVYLFQTCDKFEGDEHRMLGEIYACAETLPESWDVGPDEWWLSCV